MTIRIETDRLILRPLEPRDAEAHIAMMGEDGVAAFLSPSKQPQTSMDRWRQFASYLGHWQLRGFGFFSVEEKETGDWIGRVGPWQPQGWPGLECGWSITGAHWGKGYAPEAAIASMKWTFTEFPDLERIISVIEPENKNSRTVAAKVGQQKTGEIFELWDYVLDIWAADRDPWLARFG